MQLSSESADEANGSFGPSERNLQDLKPGFESAEREREVTEEGHHLRRSSDSDVPRAGLAERIRREARTE